MQRFLVLTKIILSTITGKNVFFIDENYFDPVYDVTIVSSNQRFIKSC